MTVKKKNLTTKQLYTYSKTEFYKDAIKFQLLSKQYLAKNQDSSFNRLSMIKVNGSNIQKLMQWDPKYSPRNQKGNT